MHLFVGQKIKVKISDFCFSIGRGSGAIKFIIIAFTSSVSLYSVRGLYSTRVELRVFCLSRKISEQYKMCMLRALDSDRIYGWYAH